MGDFMKIVTKLIKKVIFAFLLLYTYNLVATSFNLIVPINYITVGLLTFLDAPGLILLVSVLRLFYWG